MESSRVGIMLLAASASLRLLMRTALGHSNSPIIKLAAKLTK